MKSPLFGLAVVLLIIALRSVYMQWKRRRFAILLKSGADAVKNKDFAGAESAFRDSVRLAPTSAQIRLALGAVLAQRQKFKEAEEQLRLAAQLEPRKPLGHLELGFFLALSAPDRSDEAVAAFAEAVKCAPQVREGLAKDPRLAGLRQHAEFQKLLETP
ncbi:MAG TPA: tetratricopeptide repeat protein [Candidatus Bathyarchaeia archaeon]|nr:tetratricopeptide repeat protein [Candidatus Bathyarchaeia archaeon]